MKQFHCCATCIHYEVVKADTGTIRRCKRLNFETKPTYQFNCWTPKEIVKKHVKAMQKKDSE